MTQRRNRNTGGCIGIDDASDPPESGRYCAHCVDENGELQDFDTRLARMTAWQRRSHPEQSEEQVVRETLAYLATMPAWRDHPRVVAGT